MDESKPETQSEAGEWLVVDLRDPALAAVLAWLVPGAGHLYQRRYAKAVLFFVCILGTFLYGLYLGRGRDVFVYGGWKPERFRWPYLCQVAVGLPALPALVQVRRQPVDGLYEWNNWYMPPRSPGEWDALHKDLNRRLELGTVFTMIAGLLNVLAIFDAWGGPAFASFRSAEEKSPAGDADGQPAPAA